MSRTRTYKILQTWQHFLNVCYGRTSFMIPGPSPKAYRVLRNELWITKVDSDSTWSIYVTCCHIYVTLTPWKLNKRFLSKVGLSFFHLVSPSSIGPPAHKPKTPQPNSYTTHLPPPTHQPISPSVYHESAQQPISLSAYQPISLPAHQPHNPTAQQPICPRAYQPPTHQPSCPPAQSSRSQGLKKATSDFLLWENSL
jgi:hypothetical protein